MIKKLDGVFSSSKLEKEFVDKQLDGIMLLHKTFQIFLLISYSFIFVISIFQGDRVLSTMMIVLGLSSIGQLIYFHRNHNYKSLTCLNVSNIFIALLDYYGVYQVQTGQLLNVTDEFFYGALFFSVHLALLINPCFSSNVIVISICYVIHTVFKALTNGPFHILSTMMIPCIALYLAKLHIELSMKRNLFMMKKEKSEWENIIKILIDYPYLILTFCSEEQKFILTEANNSAKSELKIQDSISMRSVLREMVSSLNQTKKLISFEAHLFKIITQVEFEDIDGKLEYNITFQKTKYMVQIFTLDSQSKSLLITFKNQERPQFLKDLKQMIINQQIACCNLANQQLKFCRIMEQSTHSGDKQKSIITIHKNIYQISNLLGQFKTDHKIKITQFNLQKSIIKIGNLFPEVNFYFVEGRFICSSDIIVLRQIIFNLFSVFKASNTSFINIEGNPKSTYYTIKLDSRPISKSFFQALKNTYDNITLSHLNRIQKSPQEAFLLFHKNLKILSPDQQIELIYDSQMSITILFKSSCNYCQILNLQRFIRGMQMNRFSL